MREREGVDWLAGWLVGTKVVDNPVLCGGTIQVVSTGVVGRL